MEEQFSPLPLPDMFSSQEKYSSALKEWEKEIQSAVLRKKVTNQTSAFLRRPQFNEMDARYKYGYPKSSERIHIFNNIVNENEYEKVKFWVYEKNQWPSARVSRVPIAQMYDNYESFENQYVKWYEENSTNFEDQLMNCNDVTDIDIRRQQIKCLSEDKFIEKINNFHPSKILSTKQETNELSNGSTAKNVSFYEEKNDFYKWCSKKSVSKGTEKFFTNLFGCVEFSPQKEKNIEPLGIKSLVSFGPSTVLRPFSQLRLPRTPETNITYIHFMKLLNIDPEFLMKSDQICEQIVCFLYSSIFLKNSDNLLLKSEDALVTLAFICWRYQISAQPPLFVHLDSGKRVHPLIRALWSLSVRISALHSLVKIVGTLPKSKKIVSLFNSWRKALESEKSTLIKKSKKDLSVFFTNFKNDDEAFAIVDIFISTFDNESSPETQPLLNYLTTFDFMTKLYKTAPKVFRYLVTCIVHSLDLMKVYLKGFTQWDLLSARDIKGDILGFIYLLFSIKKNLAPSSIFDTIDWIMIVVSQMMQNVASYSHVPSAQTVAHILSFFMKCESKRKKKAKNWDIIVESLLGILSANISSELSVPCLEYEIKMVSYLFYEPKLAKYSLQFICRIADPHYSIAHAAYKVLKTVSLKNKEVFNGFFETNLDTLQASFLIVTPPVMLDIMKFFALYIEKNVKEERLDLGFVSSPDRIPKDILNLIQFLYDCNLQPKKVVATIKKISPRPPEISKNVGSMEKLMKALSKRRTLMKFILLGGGQ